MLIDAMKSAGPKMMVSTRGDAAAIASTFDQAARVLDLRLDADAADARPIVFSIWVSVRSSHSTCERLHLRQHDAVEVGAGALDDVDHVAVCPLRGQVVHRTADGLAPPVAVVQLRRRRCPGAVFGVGCDGVLEVQEHLIGRQALCLFQHLRADARHRRLHCARTEVWSGIAAGYWARSRRRLATAYPLAITMAIPYEHQDPGGQGGKPVVC